jgi:iron(III) transport system ATP-binding protein
MTQLQCRAIAKSFGKRAVLRDVDLEVPEGTLTAILGSSGSGKTTLLRVIAGFIAPDAGTVSIGGSPVAIAGRRPVPPDRRGLGYVAQEGALYPHLRVGENVGFGLPRGQRKKSTRIGEMLELVGLDPRYIDRFPHELSGGEQRRVALARALAPLPRLVLLDEPFSGLDASLRVETREAVLRALAEEGSTTVMVTHDQAEALSMGREVAVLREGEVVQTASPAVLYQTPADLDLARFVGEAVVLRGEARGSLVTCPLGTLEVLHPSLSGTVLAMIRPEQIRLTGPATQGVPDTSRPGAFPPAARVLGHTRFGPDTVVKLALPGSGNAPIAARTFERELPEIGELVRVSVVGPVVTYPETTEHAARTAEREHPADLPERVPGAGPDELLRLVAASPEGESR